MPDPRSRPDRAPVSDPFADPIVGAPTDAAPAPPGAAAGTVDPGELVFNARWAAATKLDLDVGTIATWDHGLLRDSRLLVPIDVQALFVPEGGDEPMVRLPSALNAPEG